MCRGFFESNCNICTQHVLNLYFLGNSMNNLLSYFGLTDARMRASEKDLTVRCLIQLATKKEDANKIYRLVLLPIGEYVLTSINLTALSVPK